MKLLYEKIKHTHLRASIRTILSPIILVAIETGKTTEAEFLLTEDSERLCEDDAHSIMKAAIESGGAGLFKAACKKGRRYIGSAEVTALFKLAVERGHKEAMKVLVKYWPGVVKSAADAYDFVAAAVKCSDRAVFESVWTEVSQRNMQPEALQKLPEIAAATRHRFAAKVLLAAGARLLDARELIPLLSAALSSSDIGLRRLMQWEIRKLTYELRISFLQAVVRDKNEDKNALRLAIDTVCDSPVDTRYGYGPLVVEVLKDRCEVNREMMRYLLRRPACVPTFAYAADLESGDSSISWLSIVMSYFDGPDRDWIARTAAKALSSMETVGGISLLLGHGAAAHMDKHAAFAALHCVCNEGGFELIPVLLNSRAGLALSGHECRELWRLAKRRVAGHIREDPSASALYTHPLRELRQRAKVKQTLT